MMKDWYREAEKAVDYLRESEEEYARYRGLMKSISAREKIVLARLMRESPENTAAGKKMWAEAHEDFEAAVDESQEIQQECDLITARRERAYQVIEVYRSVNSSLKRGNIA